MKFPSPILAAARLAFISGALAAFFAATSIAAPGTGESRAPAAQSHSTSGAHEMDLQELEKRVRATRAISVFQKLELQQEVNELLARFRQVHSGQTSEISTLRRPYERLIASIQSRLGRDPQLAGEISASREAIWGVLTDRTKFASI
jgi:hypothetical protein